MSELADELVDAPESDVDAQVDGGADDPSVARADEPEAPPSATPQFDFNDPQVQAQLAGMSQQSALALLEQLGLVSYQDDTPQAPDPLTSDNYAAEQQAYLDAMLARQLGPIQQYVQAQQAEQTNRVIDTALSEAAAAAKLEGADSGLLRSVAMHFAEKPEYARYGATEAGVRATAQAAAQWLAAERKSAGEAAILNYRKQIGEIQDTPAEPAGGASGGLPISQKPKTYDDIIAKHVDRVA